MLTVPDLINIQYIPEINDISLMLMVDFYEQYLCSEPNSIYLVWFFRKQHLYKSRDRS